MPQAHGARAQVALAVMTVYGTDPAGRTAGQGHALAVVNPSNAGPFRGTCTHPQGGCRRRAERARNRMTGVPGLAPPGGQAGHDPVRERRKPNVRATAKALFQKEWGGLRCGHGRHRLSLRARIVGPARRDGPGGLRAPRHRCWRAPPSGAAVPAKVVSHLSRLTAISFPILPALPCVPMGAAHMVLPHSRKAQHGHPERWHRRGRTDGHRHCACVCAGGV